MSAKHLKTENNQSRPTRLRSAILAIRALFLAVSIALSGSALAGDVPYVHQCDAHNNASQRSATMNDALYKQLFKGSSTYAVRSELVKSINILNARLFNNELPPLMVTTEFISLNIQGYFLPEGFWSGPYPIHEVSINPLSILTRTPEANLYTVIHELVHALVYKRGERSLGGFHSQTFADEMEKRGLITSASGRVGGARTGVNMTHYVLRNGPAERVVAEMLSRGFRKRWHKGVQELRQSIKRKAPNTFGGVQYNRRQVELVAPIPTFTFGLRIEQ